MVAIVHTFLFNGEADVFGMHVATVAPHVDFIVVVESMSTFSGRSKERPFIADCDVPDSARGKLRVLLTRRQCGDDAWAAEREQRNAVRRHVRGLVGGRPFILVCVDVDEIPHPEALRALRNLYGCLDRPVRIPMRMYYYNFTWRKRYMWFKPFAINDRGLDATRASLDDLRTSDVCESTPALHPAGWHCSYFMHPDEIVRKLRSFAHTEFDRPEYTGADFAWRTWRGRDFALRGADEELVGDVPTDLPERAMEVHARLMRATRIPGRLRVGFFANQLSLRGTEVAMYDYADLNETILGNQSIIMSIRGADASAVDKFQARFPVLLLEGAADVSNAARRCDLDVIYMIKGGWRDDLPETIPGVRTCVHAVFESRTPHGDVTAVVSRFVNAKHGTDLPVVPHVVRQHTETADMRAALGIPRGARVFGRHGGHDTFDIPFVWRVVENIARARPDVFFVFMNTQCFVAADVPGNIVFLPGTSDDATKQMFVNTCDAMLHARKDGETFGLACAEFAAAGRPVLTWAHSKDRNHIEELGELAVAYEDADDLVEKILSADSLLSRSASTSGYLRYGPDEVMERFCDVFLRQKSSSIANLNPDCTSTADAPTRALA